MTPDLHDLELLLRSDTPIVLIESIEEPRVVELFSRLALRISEPGFRWTVTDGLRRIEYDSEPQRMLAEPTEVLRHIRVTPQRGLYLLLDFHPYLDTPLHVRLLKEIAQGYAGLPRTLVLLSHALEAPPELRHLSARFTLRLPDRNRLMALIREEAKAWQQVTNQGAVRATRESVNQLANNLLGITESDARRLIRNAIRRDGAITQDDVADVRRAKYELLSPEGIISFEYDTRSFADIAGSVQPQALDRAEARGLPRPRAPARPSARPAAARGAGRRQESGGQGGGRLFGRAAAAAGFRRALQQIHRRDRAQSAQGTGDRRSDGALRALDGRDRKGRGDRLGGRGVGRRVLGTLLTWMAERRSRVFLAATANDIQRLPPELIRKGRLDEIFFVDLPTAEIRRDIFAIHLRQRGLNPGDFDLDALAEASEGFTGAGIEQVVVSACFADSTREGAAITTETLLTELANTQPLSVVMDAQIERLRAWAQGRTVPAHEVPPSV
jgi:hypothetical protein